MEMTQQSTSASATATQQDRRTQLLTYKQVAPTGQIPQGRMQLITWVQAAQKLKVSQNTCRKILAEAGVLPVAVGRSVRLIEDEVDAAIAKLPREQRRMPTHLAAARGLTPPAP